MCVPTYIVLHIVHCITFHIHMYVSVYHIKSPSPRTISFSRMDYGSREKVTSHPYLYPVIFTSSTEIGEIPRSLWTDRMSWAKWKPDHPQITG